ncbi:fumarylacetoacetate (FAA) hydrolase [Sphingomonas sp. DBB INV C78]|uniref:fumarylacetoacetate hydrolase family protein n=1 Tax=Sphingomonas sp. DBB INV C78 TaxID=3349434 RepID=UPI0036D2752C
MSLVLPAPAPTLVDVVGGGTFPVRRVWCVGRNYAAHVREMGGDPSREPPFFFAKPTDAIVPGGGSIPYPPMTSNLHHEIELVVAIGKGGDHIAEEDALDHVFGYAAGIDLTRRDIQADARMAGRPWDMAKGFDRSGPCGPITRAADFDPSAGRIRLDVNGATRQASDLSGMIWTVPETISALSRYVALGAGDLIFTGTPDGVGPLVAGDVVYGLIDGLEPIEIRIG